MEIIALLWGLLEALSCVAGLLHIPFIIWQFLNGSDSTQKTKFDEWEYISWQNIAQANKLSYSSNNSAMEMQGHYNGHFVTFKTHVRWRQIFTAIELTKQSQDKTNMPQGVEALLAKTRQRILMGEISMAQTGTVFVYNQTGIETNAKYITYILDTLSDFANSYQSMIHAGGTAVPTLHTWITGNSTLAPIAKQLLAEIGRETSSRLANKIPHLVCPNCLTRCVKHPLKLSRYSLNKIHYYGCRKCGQSQTFLDVPGDVIAVLDTQMLSPYQRHDEALWVNWLKQDGLFDFDQIRIQHATDEAVERLVMQLGNNTNALFQWQSRNIKCQVATRCDLSENTWRLLENQFGEVSSSEPI